MEVSNWIFVMSSLVSVHLVVFILGLGFAAGLSWAAIRFVGPKGFLDHPDARKVHAAPIPRTGGLALVLAASVGVGVGLCDLAFHPLEWVGLLAMTLIGLADDRFTLRARYKAVVGLGAAMAMAAPGASEYWAAGLPQKLVGLDLPHHWWLYWTILTLFYWCVPQSFNLIDGVNGLALGFAGVVLGLLGLMGEGHAFLLGAVGGVALWNWPRARHFMGDCGSMAIGTLLALLTAKAFRQVDPNFILWMFAYPFIDTTMVVVLRVFKGHHPARADRSHLHHRWHLLLAGRDWLIAPVLLVQAAACASAGVMSGPWMWVPRLALGALAIQALVFIMVELRSLRQPKDRPPSGADRQGVVLSK